MAGTPEQIERMAKARAAKRIQPRAEGPEPGHALAMLKAKARGAAVENVVEEFIDDDTKAANGKVTVSRSGFGKLPVYVLTPNGVVRRHVNIQSIEEVLRQPHYSAVCFDCGSDRCSGEMNGCTGRPARLYRVCPVRSCSKSIYDTVPTGQFLSDEFDHADREDTGDDPNIIRDTTYSNSTPASRTKAAMDLHLIAFHSATAAELGIGRPAEMPRLAVV